MAPRAQRHRPARVLGGFGLAAGTVGVLAYVGLGDPHRPGFLFPTCPFKLLTGWNCPACGGLRMTHDLLHGDLGAAVVDNMFLLVGLPALAFWALWRARRGARVLSPPAMLGIAVAAIGWTVVRNLPGFPLIPTTLNG